jgi:hypothetical protein
VGFGESRGSEAGAGRDGFGRGFLQLRGHGLDHAVSAPSREVAFLFRLQEQCRGVVAEGTEIAGTKRFKFPAAAVRPEREISVSSPATFPNNECDPAEGSSRRVSRTLETMDLAATRISSSKRIFHRESRTKSTGSLGTEAQLHRWIGSVKAMTPACGSRVGGRRADLHGDAVLVAHEGDDLPPRFRLRRGNREGSGIQRAIVSGLHVIRDERDLEPRRR